MLPVYKYPEKKDWKVLLQRPVFDTSSLEASVSNILKEVKQRGDEAIRKFASMFDKVTITDIQVTEEEIETASNEVDDALKAAIIEAKSNIERFHAAQLKEEEAIETMPGIKCWRKNVAIEKVGLYIPGGTAPLFSTILMLATPAKIAGCKEIVLCTPPNKEGKVHPAILYTASLVGVTQIFKAGGAQAIAGMAYGTETIPQVYKIFGPGNQYVTAAKQLVQKDGVAIDMPAGPSEVAVLADESADAAFVAADLLSQAEHGSDSQVVLVTTSENFALATAGEVELQLKELPRAAFAAKALEQSKIIVVKETGEAIEFLNEYAPEHLIISCEDDEIIADKIINAGSVFLGNYSPESVGDYASGTNHTLPTNGFAKAFSGVSVDSFVKKITYQKLTREGLKNISKTVQVMAAAEGLDAHANAVAIRLLARPSNVM
ncbi:MAG: histidinol dehydrogenase [Segetibacter sp.]|nr:histidinol dehydrogenase [Segetibacter sp.]